MQPCSFPCKFPPAWTFAIGLKIRGSGIKQFHVCAGIKPCRERANPYQIVLGIIPAAGRGIRIQPLGCSKELLPVGFREGAEGQRPKAVSEYLIERMLRAGADRLCFVIGPEKTDMVRYYARHPLGEKIFYRLQPEPLGLCDAIFRAAPLAWEREPVLIGLPDTLWWPDDLYARAIRPTPHLITFPSSHPEDFDAVESDGEGRVMRIEVKKPGARGRRIWGAITLPGHKLHECRRFWLEHGGREAYLGDLWNRWMEAGQAISCDQAGETYMDVGTLEGYHEALSELKSQPGHVFRPAQENQPEALPAAS